MDPRIPFLLDALDEAYGARSWHGTNLKGALRGLQPAQLLWRPGPGRPNCWELALHAAYWKYAVRRLIEGGPRGGFPLEGSNWFPREAGTEAQWRRDRALLESMHRDLRAAVANLDPRRLDRPASGKDRPLAWVLRGAVAHDLHHGGQIQLIKRLQS